MALSSQNHLDWLRDLGVPNVEPVDASGRAGTPPKARARRERQATERQEHRERTRKSRAARDELTTQVFEELRESGQACTLTNGQRDDPVSGSPPPPLQIIPGCVLTRLRRV